MTPGGGGVAGQWHFSLQKVSPAGLQGNPPSTEPRFSVGEDRTSMGADDAWTSMKRHFSLGEPAPPPPLRTDAPGLGGNGLHGAL